MSEVCVSAPSFAEHVKQACAATTVVLGLASCTGVAEESQPPEPAVLAEAPSPTTYEPQGICYQPDMASNVASIQQAAAEYCIDAMDNGHIAMVVTGHPDNFELLAAGIERVVNQASQGTVNVEVDVLGTPMEVAGAFSRAMGDEDCVDIQEVDEQGDMHFTSRRWLSVIADQEMADELDEYHGVLGVTEFGVCRESGTQGIGQLGGRYAELFYVNPFADASQVTQDAVEGGHEVFHLFALQHSGEAMHPDGFFPHPGIPFDLLKHLQESTYHEYAAGNRLDVMGLSGDNMRVSLNAVHLDNLARFRSIVEGDAVVLSQQVDSQWRMFTEDDASANRFARVGLSAPVTLTRKVGDQEIPREFDAVAVVPLVDDDGLYSARLYLTNADGYVVSIGGVPAGYRQPFEQRYAFEINGDTLFVQSGPNGVWVQKAATPVPTATAD